MDFSCVRSWERTLFTRFLSESGFKEKTRRTYRAGLLNFAAWCHANGISEPDTGSLNLWKAYLLDCYQAATAQTYLAAVKLFCKWLAVHGFGKDIGLPVKGIKSELGFRKDCLSENDMQKVLGCLETKIKKAKKHESCFARELRNYAIVLLITTCGLRVSEVSSLDMGDLDAVLNQPVLWVYGKGRNGKTDFVSVPPALKILLVKYFNIRHRLTKGFMASEPMFISYSRNSYGKRLSARTISQIVKKALIDAGFNSSRLTAHSLRHTAVTLALKAGATLQQVQQYARHRLMDMTLRYAHNLEHARNPCSDLVMKMIGRLDYSGIPIA
ncbi:MAG: tyrosine-type recombinase/integrase [Oxalobacter sp.]